MDVNLIFKKINNETVNGGIYAKNKNSFALHFNIFYFLIKSWPLTIREIRINLGEFVDLQ